MKSVYERWCRLQALFDNQKPIAFWNCIVKLVQFHAAQHAATANPLTDDDDVLQYLVSLLHHSCQSATLFEQSFSIYLSGTLHSGLPCHVHLIRFWWLLLSMILCAVLSD